MDWISDLFSFVASKLELIEMILLSIPGGKCFPYHDYILVYCIFPSGKSFSGISTYRRFEPVASVSVSILEDEELLTNYTATRR